jgi:excisionase family DNA binding protein
MDLTTPEKRHTLPENKPLLRAQEVANYLDISKAQVYHLIKIGQIPALYFGKVVRIRRSDIINLVDGAGNGNHSYQLNGDG